MVDNAARFCGVLYTRRRILSGTQGPGGPIELATTTQKSKRRDQNADRGATPSEQAHELLGVLLDRRVFGRQVKDHAPHIGIVGKTAPGWHYVGFGAIFHTG